MLSESKLLTWDRRTEDRHPMITIGGLEPNAQVSYQNGNQSKKLKISLKEISLTAGPNSK